MKVLAKVLGSIILVIVAIMGLALLLAIPLWLLWNWLVPVIFVGGGIAPEITLLQALGITLLSSILFKSPSPSSKS